MEPTFRYFLKSDDSTYYTVENDNVVTTSIKTEQENSPKGWKDSQIIFTRDMNYYGVFYSASEQGTAQFVKESRKILRFICSTIGYIANCILYVEILNTTTFEYEFYYQGNIDFSARNNFQFEFDCNIVTSGIQQIINTLQDTTYELSLDVPEAVTMVIDGVFVKSSAVWYLGDYSENTGTTPRQVHGIAYGDNDFGSANSIPAYNDGDIDQIFPFIKSHNQSTQNGTLAALIRYNYNSGGNNATTPDAGIFIFRTNTDLKDVTLSGQYTIFADFPTSGTKTIESTAIVMTDTNPSLVYSPGGIPSIFLLNTYTTSLSGQIQFQVDIDVSFDMPERSYLIIVNDAKTTKTGGDTGDIYFPNDTAILNITFLAKVSPTETKCLRYYDAMNQLINKMTNGTASLTSSLYNVAAIDSLSRAKNWDTAPYFHFLTSGNALQGIVGSTIKTSWSEMFKDSFSRMMISLNIDNNDATVESLGFAFEDTLIATIDETNNMNEYGFNEKIYNDSKTGYASNNNNTAAGKDEYNTQSEYIFDSIVNPNLKKDDDIVSGYIAATSQIEQIRGLTLTSDQVSTTTDNSTFIIEADPTPDPITGKYIPYRPPGTITGVDDPIGGYNFLITPGRNTRRHRPRYRSTIPFGNMVFQTSDMNQSLVSTFGFGSGQVIESDNIPLVDDIYQGHVDTRLFDWNIFEFDCVPPFNLLNQVKANPRGYIRFHYYDNVYLEGYIYEISLTPASGATHCKLIGRAQNNPLLLNT